MIATARLIRRGALAVAVAATIALSGCAPSAPTDVESGLSAELTSAVSTVADTATTGDYAGALSRLDELSGNVDAAGADGRISAERLTTLQSTIATVRADLEALLAAAQAAEAEQAAQSTPAPTPTSEPVTQTPATDVSEDPEQEAPDDDQPVQQPTGPGENNGKGPGDAGKKDDKGPGKKN